MIGSLDLMAPAGMRCYGPAVNRASMGWNATHHWWSLEIRLSHTIRTARLGLGGIATKPWRATEAEQSLTGRKASDATFRDSAEIALAGASGREYNHFKIELAKRTIVRAFALAKDMDV